MVENYNLKPDWNEIKRFPLESIIEIINFNLLFLDNYTNPMFQAFSI